MKLIILIFVHCVTCIQGVRIDIDTSASPDLRRFGSRVKATLEDWYPRVSKLLYSPKFRNVDRIPIQFDPKYDKVAYELGGRIVGSVKYYRSHQNDVGSMVHEMAHVIQKYRNCPSWVTEGMADWVRYYHYEPNRKPGKPGRNNRYTDGYGVSAYFLNWVEKRYKRMIYYINKDCREGTYKDKIFQRLTGKTVSQLWNDMMRS